MSKVRQLILHDFPIIASMRKEFGGRLIPYFFSRNDNIMTFLSYNFFITML